MKHEGDEVLEAVLAQAKTIRLEEVWAKLAAAVNDPLLQDIVDQALAGHEDSHGRAAGGGAASAPPAPRDGPAG